MARYIDADKAIQQIRKQSSRSVARECAVNAVNNTPIEDVAPVIHAHWKIIYESSAGVTDARCSNCGYESIAYENDVHTDKNCNYCPCCGAKMDEEEGQR